MEINGILENTLKITDMKEIKIITPQFDRTGKLDFDKPKTEQEFYNLVNNAPFDILKGYGFRKWDTMNNVIRENIANADEPTMISVPTYSIDEAVNVIKGEEAKPSGDMILEIGCKRPTPKELLKIDEDILLLPHEWYDIIPNGFIVTGLYGESYPFEKGKTDNDKRFGCLAYGVRRKIN